MVFKKWLLMTLGALALGIGGFGVSAQGAMQQCASEECACEEALNQNTVEALEEFLKKYPHASSQESACAALAVPPAEGVSGSGDENKEDDQVPAQSSNSFQEG